MGIKVHLSEICMHFAFILLSLKSKIASSALPCLQKKSPESQCLVQDHAVHHFGDGSTDVGHARAHATRHV